MNLKSISLLKSKRLRNYNDIISSIVTYVIHFNIRIKKHERFTISMFIIDIEDHEIILNKSWINQCDLLLNIKNDSLIFFEEISLIKIESSNDLTIFKTTTADLNIFTFSKKIQILSRRRPNSKKQFFYIHNVSAKSFNLLTRQQEIQIFIIFMKNIDQQLQFDVKSQTKSIDLNNVKAAIVNLQNINKRLSSEYYDYLDVRLTVESKFDINFWSRLDFRDQD